MATLICNSAIAQSAATPPDAKDPLEPLIVSALQVPRDPTTVTSAVTVLDPEKLIGQGIYQLRDALNESPGVISTSTSAQTGAPASFFIRGTSTQYAQVVVDGMRLGNSNNQLGNILGGARTYDVGTIEVLRGPQGAIYGGESIGGVLWMETPYGSGSPHGATSIEAGSFNSFNTYSMFQGQTGNLSYYLTGGYESTDNDAPHNRFEQASAALRVEGKVNSTWTFGTTYRGLDSSGQDLDTLYSNDSESSVTNALSTVYAVGKISDRWTARFHVGYYQEFYDNNYKSFGFPYSYFSDLHAGSLTTDHEITLADNLRLLAGAFVYQDSYESSISDRQNGDRYGAHATLEWDVIHNLTTTASLRWEDYDAFGDELTWRLGSIYTLAATGTSLRGGIGTSFRAPTYMELYGSSYSVGNPQLHAESSTGWDLGIEQKIGSHHTLGLTWFNNRITDQIVSPYTYPATLPYNQQGNSTTDGLELGMRGSWFDQALSYRVAWTYLHESLKNIGQPRNATTASLDWKPTAKTLIGVGASYLADHTWGGDTINAYTISRIYGSYQITDRIKVHARLENAFNESYYLFNSSDWGSVVQGAGTGFYTGLAVDW